MTCEIFLAEYVAKAMTDMPTTDIGPFFDNLRRELVVSAEEFGYDTENIWDDFWSEFENAFPGEF